jgi:protein TonB
MTPLQAVIRIAAGLFVAFFVTAGLFLMMRALVGPPTDVIEEQAEATKIDIGRQQRDEIVRPDRAQPERPERAEPPPPPPSTRDIADKANVEGVSGALPDFNSKMNEGSGLLPDDFNIQPEIRVPPEYPQRPAQRGIEGYVILEFDITPQGEPFNIRVVEEEPQGYFARAAVRAVTRWKYAPKTVNGRQVVREDVRTRLTFNLEGDGR